MALRSDKGYEVRAVKKAESWLEFGEFTNAVATFEDDTLKDRTKYEEGGHQPPEALNTQRFKKSEISPWNHKRPISVALNILEDQTKSNNQDSTKWRIYIRKAGVIHGDK